MTDISDEIRKVADEYDVYDVLPLYELADRIGSEMVELPKDDGRMSRTDLDPATLAASLRRMVGDGSVEWVTEPMQTRVLLDVADMLDENAKLREQMERLVTLLRVDCDIDASWDGLRRFWIIGLTEDGCLMRDRACKAEAENAKLRELAERAWKTAERLCQAFGGPCSDDGVTIAKPCPMDGRDEECIYGQLRKELLELGIEVDA